MYTVILCIPPVILGALGLGLMGAIGWEAVKHVLWFPAHQGG